MELDDVKCPVCGSDHGVIAVRRRDLLIETERREWEMLECTRCASLYLSPRPRVEDMSHFYRADYLGHDRSHLAQPHRFNYGIRKRASYVQRHIRSRGTVLDVGCGTGEFMACMQSRGWKTCGVEFSTDAAADAKAAYNLDIFAGSIEDYISTLNRDNLFDAITLWDVLEHLHDPVGVLDRLSKLLNPGGAIFLSTPDPASRERFWFGSSWVGFELPRHLVLMSPKSLGQAARSIGLSSSPPIRLFGSHSYFMSSVLFRLKQYGVKADLAIAAYSALNSLPVRAMMLPIFQILDKVGWTMNYTITLRRLHN